MSIPAVTLGVEEQKISLPSVSLRIGYLSQDLSPRAKKVQDAVAEKKRNEVAGYVCEYIKNGESLKAQKLYQQLSELHNTIVYCAERVIFEKTTLLMFQAGLLNMPLSKIAGGYVPFGKAEERWVTNGYASLQVMEEVQQLQRKSQRFLDHMNGCISARETFYGLKYDCLVYLENEIRKAKPEQPYKMNLDQFTSVSFDRTKGIKEVYPELQKEAVKVLEKTKKLLKSLDEKEKPILEEELNKIIASLQNFVSWKPDFSQSVLDLRTDLIAHFWRGKNYQCIKDYLFLIHPAELSSILKVAKSFLKNKEFDLAIEVHNYILSDNGSFLCDRYSVSMLTLELYLAGALKTNYLQVRQKLVFAKWEKTYEITGQEAEEMNQLQEKCSGFISAYQELTSVREWCFLVECNPSKDPSRKEKAGQILKRFEEFNEMFSLEFFKTAVMECRESLQKIKATDFSEIKPV